MKNWNSKKLFISRAQDKDRARREFILNVLLAGSILLSFIASLVSWSVTFSQKKLIRFESIETTCIFLLFCAGFLWSRLGNSKIVAYFFIGFYLLITVFASFRWGAEIPNGLLSYALIIVMTGILINSRVAFIASSLISIIIIVLVYLQSTNILYHESSWRSQPETVANAISYGVTLFIIAIVSWLFNRETESALKRARLSEKALKEQNDKLEAIVEERTRQLKKAQVEKLAQLYRFVELGRITSGLFHELASPLTLISLNLDELSRNKLLKRRELSDIEKNIKKAINGTKTLENFLSAARKQIQSQEVNTRFSLAFGIAQVIQIVEHKAKDHKVKIDAQLDESLILTGNPIKFNQLISNLVVNAIESYDLTTKKNRKVVLKLTKVGKEIKLSIQDFGKGIEKMHINRIFEPLFTTKTPEKGTGIGLFLSKEIVEKDFGGKIEVNSTQDKGTTFTMCFPLKNLR